jgi:outer membrane lipoprotein SlyB
MKISSLAFASIIAVSGIGFSAGANADPYRDRNDHRYEVCDNCGTVRSISRVNRRNSNNTGAIVLGAVVGGVLGNQVGGGSGKKVATVAGAVAGGAIANNATRDDKRKTYYRIEVRMDNGRIRSYDQSSTHGLRVGSRVEIHRGSVHREG